LKEISYLKGNWEFERNADVLRDLEVGKVRGPLNKGEPKPRFLLNCPAKIDWF